MSERNATRRSVLKATGAALGAAALPSVASAAETDSEWTAVKSPVGGTLSDVEETSAGAYAVGDAGVVLERTAKGWKKILDGGPTGNGNNLYGADVTDDGKRLWFVGSSGSIGEYDVTTGNLNDHSAPMDVTNNFNDVAVTGEAGEANVYVAGDSGKLYYSFENGAGQTWDYVTPGSGSAINAVDFYDDRKGHIVDGNKSVFHTQDGSTWDKVGLADANVNFYGVDSDGADDVWVSGGGGMIFHWDGVEWTPTDTGDAGLRDVEVDGDDGLTVGGGGNVYDRESEEWKPQTTPAGQNLKAVLLRSDPEIAVGSGGAILEH
ncbi:WD40/YVTN/BNR-like repeat-containing protein [Halosimplex sp. J119]